MLRDHVKAIIRRVLGRGRAEWTEPGLAHDPQEDDPQLKAAFLEADRLARGKARSWRGEGHCVVFWQAKKKILRERFGIDWRTPEEMNPDTLFD